MHISETQTYCFGNWKDSMSWVSALPGLYIISAGLRHLYQYILFNVEFHQKVVVSCSTSFLRGINAFIFGPLTTLIIWLILNEIHGHKNKFFCVLRLLRTVTFPLHFFFQFLYYTDCASTFFVLLMYYLTLRQKIVMSCLGGCIAMCINQVWIHP